jgi:hypothetical protein
MPPIFLINRDASKLVMCLSIYYALIERLGEFTFTPEVSIKAHNEQ